ncbi:polysaccharide deacetylase family protein [Blastococcus sp. TF02A-35]|nr:polysaccharide deacetylase family protein [Blastococcus sp. TF02A_35]
MYHSVSPSTAPDPHLLRVHPDRLDQQLRTLRRLGLRGVSLAELVDAVDRGDARGLVGLTFDDGYADFLHHAVPVLARHRMTATVYMVADRLAGTNDWDEAPQLPLMDADELRAVAAAGHEVGSHTMTHAALAGLDPASLEVELRGSREVLEQLLGAPVRGFCYPYGSFDRAAADAARAAGYDHACVTRDYSVSDRFTLPRFYVGQEDSGLRLVAKLVRHHLVQRRTGGSAA